MGIVAGIMEMIAEVLLQFICLDLYIELLL